ncbi:prephenate dehydrogenase [Roseivirga pacifica]|uniref:prephenate dehydrogenase n=1 Tax=Roseivirga pacifica TaxID=1267423 RepID=UPI00227B71FF|nr:prephenate dehydrogenase [Roseivirga pacifica]
MKITLVGVGLISGSFALGLKKALDKTIEVCGVDISEVALSKAQEIGMIDMAKSIKEATEWADVVVLGIPVDALTRLVPEVLDYAREDSLIVDFGSTKEAICEAVAKHPNRKSFLAAHPIAGTEYSGPEAAFAELFQQKRMIICESDKTGEEQQHLFLRLCEALQMRVSYMTPAEHDLHLAFVSHLSHITSFALSNAVMRKEKSERHIFEMAGSGFASTVRLAKSSPDMWAPIFTQNRKHLLEGLSTYIEELQHFQKLLETEDQQGMKDFMNRANRIREIVDRIG